MGETIMFNARNCSEEKVQREGPFHRSRQGITEHDHEFFQHDSYIDIILQYTSIFYIYQLSLLSSKAKTWKHKIRGKKIYRPYHQKVPDVLL